MRKMLPFVAEGLRQLQSLLAFAKLLPRTRRVRRRGFQADVRRGDVVEFGGRKWNVARRSNWNLWLYEHTPMREGAVVRVRVPRRYS